SLADAEQVVRFRLEAETAARLRHPNVVQVYEAGVHEGRPFIVMEWVEGGTLAQYLRGRPQPLRETAALVETLARAVHAAHCQGVVHRDLKPANVLLASGGRKPPGHSEEPDASPEPGGLRPPLAQCTPKVADFGLAKQLTRDTHLTATGLIVGTPN